MPFCKKVHKTLLNFVESFPRIVKVIYSCKLYGLRIGCHWSSYECKGRQANSIVEQRYWRLQTLLRNWNVGKEKKKSCDSCGCTQREKLSLLTLTALHHLVVCCEYTATSNFWGRGPWVGAGHHGTSQRGPSEYLCETAGRTEHIPHPLWLADNWGDGRKQKTSLDRHLHNFRV